MLNCRVERDVRAFVSRLDSLTEGLIETTRYNLTPAWISTVWGKIEHKKKSEFFGLLVEREGYLLGYWPLLKSKRKFGFRLQNIGQEISDYADPWIAPNCNDALRDEVLLAMFHQIWSSRAEFTFVQFSSIGIEARIFDSAKQISKSCIIGEPKLNFYAKNTYPPNGEAYFKERLNTKSKETFRRKIRKLNSVGEVKFTRLSATELVPKLRDKYESWYRYSGRMDKIGTWWEFYHQCHSDLLNASALSIGDKIISLIFGFNRNNEFDMFSLTFDPAYEQYSPGLIHLYMLMIDEFNAGKTEFHFLRGEEDYKKRLANNVFETCSLCLVHARSPLAALHWLKFRYLK